MPGETNLTTLLQTMTPTRQPGAYVFCTIGSLADLAPADIVGMFREAEGLTVILPQAAADRLALPYAYEAAWLTLNVHSALEAVGLTAAVATALTEHGISCNVVAAYYHDHLFVPHADADRALRALQQLAAAAS